MMYLTKQRAGQITEPVQDHSLIFVVFVSSSPAAAAAINNQLHYDEKRDPVTQ